jgi:prolyl-tRNA synthetase
MVGMLIMSHSDDQGLVAPPRVAPVQVVIVPIGRGEGLDAATAKCRELEAELKKTVWMDHPIRVKVDDRDKLSPGFKFNEWELKGACLRIELGPRDLEAGHFLLASRLGGDKKEVALADVAQAVAAGLDEMNEALFARALAHREAHTKRVDTWDEFKACFEGEGGGGS